MMKSLIQLSFLLIVLSNFAWAQNVQVSVFILDNRKNNPLSDTIYHNANRPLTWDDFQGQPDEASEAGAVTASGFAYTANIRSSSKIFKLNIFIYTFFNKKNSWKKPKIMSDYHLRHEQLHFDITRIAAQNFRTMLLAANFTRENYSQLLKSVWQKAQSSWHVMQTAYDEETKHSIRKKDQRRWNSFVEEEIKKLYPPQTKETAYVKPTN
jgi:hypothetical protein